MFRRKPNKSASIDTLIGMNTRINGDVSFTGGMHVDGYINGNVTCDAGHAASPSASPSASLSASLSVSEHGGIEGSVTVSNVILNGIVKGDIDATERVELGEKARVMGNVHYSVLETAVGAQIHGKLVHRAELVRNEPHAEATDEPGTYKPGAHEGHL